MVEEWGGCEFVDSVIIAEENSDDDNSGDLPQDGEDDEKEWVFGEGFFGELWWWGMDLGLGLHSSEWGMRDLIWKLS